MQVAETQAEAEAEEILAAGIALGTLAEMVLAVVIGRMPTMRLLQTLTGKDSNCWGEMN